MPKISDLWAEVEKALAERTLSGLKTAIIEAQKVLLAVLDSKGFPGKNLEEKLFWAGYSLKDKNGIAEAMEKHDDILEKFEYQLSDLEAEEIVRKYKHIIDEVSQKPKYGLKDKAITILETQFTPKSVSFWRNLAVFIGFFVAIKLLSSTALGLDISDWFVEIAGFIISWQFLLLVGVIIVLAFALNVYFANKTKVKIRED
jgi:hypothetical protein